MASPVIMIMLTFSSPTSSHTRSGTKRATSTALLPVKLPPITLHCVAPCMSGAMGRLVVGPDCNPRSTSPPGEVMRSPVTGLSPPPRAKSTSSCRHTTPLGMPVVPPV